MAPICKTFVQNTWKRDLCSNCFKTKDEHNAACPLSPTKTTLNSKDERSSLLEGTSSKRMHPITSSILNRSDSRASEKAIGESPTSLVGSPVTSPTTPQSRYVGVANTTRIGGGVYQRSYYGYKSRLGDASEASGLKSPSLIFRSDSTASLTSSGLKSPGLIKEVSSSSSNVTSDESCNSDTASNSTPLHHNRVSSTISSSTSSLSSLTSNNQPRNSATMSTNTTYEKPKSSYIFSDIGQISSQSNGISNSVYKENRKNKVISNLESISSDISSNQLNIVPPNYRSKSHTSSSSHSAFPEEICKETFSGNPKKSKHGIENSYSSVRARSADNILESSETNNSQDTALMEDTFIARRCEFERVHSVDNLCKESTTKSTITNGINNIIGSLTSLACELPELVSPTQNSSINSSSNFFSLKSVDSEVTAVTDSADVESETTSVVDSTDVDSEATSVADSTDVDSEATSVADSTESDENCGGFYNIEGLNDVDEEFGDTESSTDEILRYDIKSSEELVPSGKDIIIQNESDSSIENVSNTTKAAKLKSALSKPKFKSTKIARNISYNIKDEVIGYGGDVDYSGEEDYDDDDYNDNDYDDDDICKTFELTEREKLLKRLTDENTDFNAENDNLEENVVLGDTHYELMKQYERACEDYDIFEDILASYDTCRTVSNDSKVKLKRATPLVCVKPFVSRSISSTSGDSPKVNPVLPMKNGELIRTRSDGAVGEIIPLQGIKPKYVSKDQEIIEKLPNRDTNSSCSKITSFDSPIEKYTSFGDVLKRENQINDEPKQQKITSFDMVTPSEKFSSFSSTRMELNNTQADIFKSQNVIPSVQNEALPTNSKEKQNNSSQILKDQQQSSPKLMVMRPVRQKKKMMRQLESKSTAVKSENTSSVNQNLINDQKDTQLETNLKELVSPKLDSINFEKSKTRGKENNPSVKNDTDIIQSTSKNNCEISLIPSAMETSIYEKTPSSCKRRDSFLASQLGIANEEISQKEDSDIAASVDEISNNVFEISTESTVLPILTQKFAPNSIPSYSTDRSQIQTIRKSERSKDLWSDSASNSTDNDDSKSSSSFEVGREAANSQLGSSSSSHKSSISSLTTFGTALGINSIIISANQCLQSSDTATTKSLMDVDVKQKEYAGYSTSSEFLKDIRAPVIESAPTASIQKSSSSHYASASGLKGVPGSSKPVVTPKPPNLDRQKNTNDLSNSPTRALNNAAAVRSLSSTFASMSVKPTSKEIVYDLPVTLASCQIAELSTPTPLHYSTSQLPATTSKPTINTYASAQAVTDIYYEVDLNDSDLTTKNGSPKAEFEDLRTVISSHLNIEKLNPSFNTKELHSENIGCGSQHNFHLPDVLPKLDINNVQQMNGTAAVAAYSFYQPNSALNILDSSSRTDVDSYSSFTDDFDEEEGEEDGDIEETQNTDNYDAEKETKKVAETLGSRRIGERSSSATPLHRVGSANYDPSCEYILTYS